MTYRPVCNRRHPLKGEVIVDAERLALLERKEAAHDDYLAAIRAIRQPEHQMAMLALSRAIVAEAARRMEA